MYSHKMFRSGDTFTFSLYLEQTCVLALFFSSVTEIHLGISIRASRLPVFHKQTESHTNNLATTESSLPKRDQMLTQIFPFQVVTLANLPFKHPCAYISTLRLTLNLQLFTSFKRKLLHIFDSKMSGRGRGFFIDPGRGIRVRNIDSIAKHNSV